MLVVIVIMGILVAVTIPAVTSLMKSGGLNAATREVSNSLSLARQYAITKRTTTRVIFPYYNTGASGTNLAPWYQSYSVIDMGPPISYLSKWELLPNGAVFMGNNPLSSSSSSIDGLQSGSLPFPSTNLPVTLATLAYIEFKPTGAAGQAGTLTITEGFMNAGTPTFTSISGGAVVNVTTVSVDNLVGRIAVNRP